MSRFFAGDSDSDSESDLSEPEQQQTAANAARLVFFYFGDNRRFCIASRSVHAMAVADCMCFPMRKRRSSVLFAVRKTSGEFSLQ